MGWTHYWRREEFLPNDDFKNIISDFRKILPTMPIELSGEDSIGNPLIDEKQIVFNGKSGQDCEPFIMQLHEVPRMGRITVFSYCKTERLPYDFCVQCILIISKHHLKNLILISSDGKENDWKKAKEFCQQFFGYGHEFKLDEMVH